MRWLANDLSAYTMAHFLCQVFASPLLAPPRPSLIGLDFQETERPACRVMGAEYSIENSARDAGFHRQPNALSCPKHKAAGFANTQLRQQAYGLDWAAFSLDTVEKQFYRRITEFIFR